mmetsp:Transcript_12403/g.21034  ORF Transcript_12403/g.21034 Transcript_12403/m.21034 type:complete len:150 (-) Transcript_12403:675-1124(-)
MIDDIVDSDVECVFIPPGRNRNKMELIKLDVGGYRYKTTLATLQSRRGSMLERMFGGTELSPSLLDEDGFYFIDRNGRIFEYILDFLRGFQYPPSTLPESDIELLQTEADFYGLEELRDWAGRRLITHQEEKKRRAARITTTLNIEANP